MLGNVEKIEAYKHLSEKEKAELKKYALNLTGFINIINISREKKEDIFITLVEYRANLWASDEYVRKYNRVADKMDALYEKYKKETDEEVKVELAERYRKYKNEQANLKANYDYFNGKRSALSDRAFKYDKFIDEELVNGVKNQMSKIDRNRKIPIKPIKK